MGRHILIGALCITEGRIPPCRDPYLAKGDRKEIRHNKEMRLVPPGWLQSKHALGNCRCVSGDVPFAHILCLLHGIITRYEI
jgi:hypothetical protein